MNQNEVTELLLELTLSEATLLPDHQHLPVSQDQNGEWPRANEFTLILRDGSRFRVTVEEMSGEENRG